MRLWIRADGSAETGLGHVMRTVAIAERARHRDIDVRFLVGGSEAVLSLLADRGFGADYAGRDAEAITRMVRAGDAVVFDGYRFSAEVMGATKDRGCRIGAIDDLGEGQFPVDVLLNQNPLQHTSYATLPETVTLLGPRFALVRAEFIRHRRLRASPRPRTLVVTMGGSDVAGLTTETLGLAPSRPAFDHIILVIGPSAGPPPGPIPADVEIVRAPRDVASVFARGDAAVSAAGSTTWELLSMGMPTALVQVASNQRAIGPGVESAGAGVFMGEARSYAERFRDTLTVLADPDRRAGVSRRALELVDGHGADRFLRALLGEAKPPAGPQSTASASEHDVD